MHTAVESCQHSSSSHTLQWGSKTTKDEGLKIYLLEHWCIESSMSHKEIHFVCWCVEVHCWTYLGHLPILQVWPNFYDEPIWYVFGFISHHKEKQQSWTFCGCRNLSFCWACDCSFKVLKIQRCKSCSKYIITDLRERELSMCLFFLQLTAEEEMVCLGVGFFCFASLWLLLHPEQSDEYSKTHSTPLSCHQTFFHLAVCVCLFLDWSQFTHKQEIS